MRFWLLLLISVSLATHAEEFSFDISTYSKPAYELNGFAEFLAIQSALNTESAYYNLQFSNIESPDDLTQYGAALQLEGLYRFENSQLYARLFSENAYSDVFGNEHDNALHEFYYADSHIDNLRLEIGKRLQKWGKGYAWNPVGFIERPKDPNDPDLSREGYVMLSAEYVRSFESDVKTLAFMPVVLPVTDDINTDFSSEEDTNLAGRMYVLYRDIDIDIMFLASGSRSARVGFDFSTNITPNFELHGEWAYVQNQPLVHLDSSNQIIQIQQDVIQSLIGVRYLSENDITWISEYYHNGAGYNEKQLEQYFIIAHSDPVTEPVLFNLARQLRGNGYGNVNPGKDYFYLSAIKKEPFNLVYFNMGLNTIVNLQDKSYSITPDLVYTGFNNTELRLRLTFLRGDTYSEFGEKLNEQKLEFRFRYFF